MTALRTRAFAGRVVRHAVAIPRAKSDPASLLDAAVAAPRPVNLAAIDGSREAGALRRAIEAHQNEDVAGAGAGCPAARGIRAWTTRSP